MRPLSFYRRVKLTPTLAPDYFMWELWGAVSARQWTRDRRAGCSTRPTAASAFRPRPSAVTGHTPVPANVHHGPNSWCRVYAWRRRFGTSHSRQSNRKITGKLPNERFSMHILCDAYGTLQKLFYAFAAALSLESKALLYMRFMEAPF